MQNDPLAQLYSKQLLYIGNTDTVVHQNTQFIKLPDAFFTTVQTKKELHESVFSDILDNYFFDHICPSNYVIFLAKMLILTKSTFRYNNCCQVA